MNFENYWKDFATWVYSNLCIVLKTMYLLLTKFPKISQMGELYDVWHFVTLISLLCMTICIIYLGTKLFINSASISNKIEMNTIFGRLIYATAFIASSKILIDLLIDFNNSLIDVFVSKFQLIDTMSNNIYVNGWTELVAIGLAIFQLYIAIKIMIGYFLRVAEVALMYVTNPIMCCIWVNPSWGGHLGAWISRLVSLIFTQFAQVLILIIYVKMIFGFYASLQFYNLYLGSAFLILMHQTPSWIQKYIAPDNSGKTIVNTYKEIKNNRTSLGKVYNKIKVGKEVKEDKK